MTSSIVINTFETSLIFKIKYFSPNYLSYFALMKTIFAFLVALACATVVSGYETFTEPTTITTSADIHVNPEGPPPFEYAPHTARNVKGHRYYVSSANKDNVYEQESKLTDAQLEALRMRAKEVKIQRASGLLPPTERQRQLYSKKVHQMTVFF